MKMLEHPNIVDLIEVIDDPQSDNFYMGTDSLVIDYYSCHLYLYLSLSEEEYL